MTAPVTPAAGPAPEAVADAASPAPQKLSAAFYRLWIAAIGSNLADGVGRVALPLLAASLTRDPLAISVLGALGVIPWLALGVYSGGVIDRYDRRKVMAAADVLRLAASALLVALVLTDSVTVAWVAVTVLLYGVGEVFFDNATNAVLPTVVRPALRDKANSRVQAAQVAVDLFVATPIGAALFAMAAIAPLVAAGGGYGVAVALSLALPAVAARAARGRAVVKAADGVAAEARVAGGAGPSVSLREGIAYLWNHPFLRWMTLLTSTVAASLTFAQATMLLIFLERFAVPEALLGLVASSIGVGGLTGSVVAPMLVKRWGRGRVMLWATVAGGAGLVLVAVSPNVWCAMIAYALSAGGVSTWNVPWASARQAVIPQRLMGRVLGFARTIAWGLIPVASVLGGLVGRVSLVMPFAIGGVAMLVLAAVGARLILSTDAQQPVELEEDDDAVA